jgi:hypothetical protein
VGDYVTYSKRLGAFLRSLTRVSEAGGATQTGSVDQHELAEYTDARINR